jgi:nitroreductase
MNFIELARKRQSVRKYSPQPVEPEKIERCLEAARLAPSACNAQPWSFIVVDNPELKEKIARETYNAIAPFNKFAHTAPLIIVQVMEKPNMLSQFGGRVKNKDFYLIDTGIAAEHLCLQAAEEDLGTCMIGWFNERAIKKLLNIPANRAIGLVITLGYPAVETIRDKKRKEMNEISKFNTYG